jgi:carbamoylphosphate synthase large subunit
MPDKIKLLVLPTIHNIKEIVSGIPMEIELTEGKYQDLEFRFVNGLISLILNGTDIKDFSNVWLSSYWRSRDLAYGIRLYLEHFGTPFTYVEKSSSKITDQIIFSINHITTPNTFYIDNPDTLNLIPSIERICGYPLIIKDITGSGGKDSFLIKDRFDLFEKIETLHKDKHYLYQKFIPNDFDWGILVANGKIVSAEKSYPRTGEFRNNSCNGATEIFTDPASIPEEVKEMAIKASNSLGLAWSRSDIVIDRNTNIPYLMEVNRCPGISSGTTEVTGAQDYLNAHINKNRLILDEKQLLKILFVKEQSK